MEKNSSKCKYKGNINIKDIEVKRDKRNIQNTNIKGNSLKKDCLMRLGWNINR